MDLGGLGSIFNNSKSAVILSFPKPDHAFFRMCPGRRRSFLPRWPPFLTHSMERKGVFARQGQSSTFPSSFSWLCGGSFFQLVVDYSRPDFFQLFDYFSPNSRDCYITFYQILNSFSASRFKFHKMYKYIPQSN